PGRKGPAAVGPCRRCPATSHPILSARPVHDRTTRNPCRPWRGPPHLPHDAGTRTLGRARTGPGRVSLAWESIRRGQRGYLTPVILTILLVKTMWCTSRLPEAGGRAAGHGRRPASGVTDRALMHTQPSGSSPEPRNACSWPAAAGDSTSSARGYSTRSSFRL